MDPLDPLCFSNRLPDGRGGTATQLSPDDENSRLNQAIAQADHLLVQSLQHDERQRRRKIRVAAIVGGSAMLVLGLVSLILVESGPATQPAAPPPPASPVQSVSLDVEQSDALARQGWGLWQAGKYDEADLAFLDAIRLNPKSVSAWNGRGWCELNTGSTEEAIGAFNNVIQLQPTFAAALNGLG